MAGGQQHDLAQFPANLQPAPMTTELRRHDRQFLAQLHRRGLVAKSGHKQFHFGCLRSFNQGLREKLTHNPTAISVNPAYRTFTPGSLVTRSAVYFKARGFQPVW